MNLSGVKRIRPIGKRILMQRCRQARQETVNGRVFYVMEQGKGAGLAVPESYADSSNMNEIVEVSDDCEIFKGCEGKFVISPEWSEGLNCISKEHEFWMAKEQILPAVVFEA